MCTGRKRVQLLTPLALTMSFVASNVFAQGVENPNLQTVERTDSSERPKLTEAKMCERVDNLTPIRTGIVFSIGIEQVYCFTSFDL